MKTFKLRPDEILPLVKNQGACIASDMITVDGYPVRFMYRETSHPQRPEDSGWRFLSGLEDESYMGDANRHSVYDVNTIANYDPSIIPFLASAPGTAFEKAEGEDSFVLIEDWAADDID